MCMTYRYILINNTSTCFYLPSLDYNGYYVCN